MTSIEQTIGSRIRQLRQKMELSQVQLAEAARLSVETISRYERGVLVPGLGSLGAIADALRIPLVTIFEDENRIQDLAPDLLKIINRLKDENPATIRRVYKVIEAMLS